MEQQGSAGSPRAQSRWPAPPHLSLPGAAALLIGLALSAVLALVVLDLYHRNENRLLKLRVRELALVLAATEPSIQTPLSSAADLAGATNGDARRFREVVAPEIGAKKQFTSVSLWAFDRRRKAPLVVAGEKPAISSQPGSAHTLFSTGKRPGVLYVIGMLGVRPPGLGFELVSAGPGRRFAVYAESKLPANRRSRIESNSAFSDLDYVIYLGRSERAADLLVTSVRTLPLHGRRARTTVPFGAGALTLVVTPRGSLAGTFFRDLPVIIAIVGGLLTLAASVLVDRLSRRRRRAEDLAHQLDLAAEENLRLYEEQRGIAETLQRALLPEIPDETGPLRLAARYIPAAQGANVGGDWYDVAIVDEDRVMLIIGDVSGHGLEAATTMALLRHAALAYVAQDAQPATVLSKLARFVNSRPHTYFATVLCALVEISDRRVTTASAGHLPPLILQGETSRFIGLRTSPPVGVAGGETFHETTEDLDGSFGLLAFTDGLVERPGEVLDSSLERLRRVVASERVSVDALLEKLVAQFGLHRHPDDTALLGIEWTR